jgi:hypothetical protein
MPLGGDEESRQANGLSCVQHFPHLNARPGTDYVVPQAP